MRSACSLLSIPVQLARANRRRRGARGDGSSRRRARHASSTATATATFAPVACHQPADSLVRQQRLGNPRRASARRQHRHHRHRHCRHRHPRHPRHPRHRQIGVFPGADAARCTAQTLVDHAVPITPLYAMAMLAIATETLMARRWALPAQDATVAPAVQMADALRRCYLVVWKHHSFRYDGHVGMFRAV